MNTADETGVKWIAHVHYTKGGVGELTFSTDTDDVQSGLNKVKDILGIKTITDPLLKYVILQEDTPGSLPRMYGRDVPAGTPTRSNVVELRPQAEFKRYRVSVYLTPAQASPVITTLAARTGDEALKAVLGQWNIRSLNQCGPYRVEEESATGRRTLFYSGTCWGNPPTHKEHIKLAHTPVSPVPTSVPVVDAFKLLLSGEKLVQRDMFNIINKEQGV